MGAAVATTPTLLQWGIAYDGTAVSLATADAASTKAPRRVPLGCQSLPALTDKGCLKSTRKSGTLPPTAKPTGSD
jgi:hypothetical protein